MLLSRGRFAYGGVNLRVTKLRELRIQSLDNYNPNKANKEYNRRPGGWFRDTFTPVPKLKGENKAHKNFVNSVSLNLRNKIIDELKRDSSNVDLAESYVSITNTAESSAPEPHEFVKERIKDILDYRANCNILYNSNQGLQAQKLLKPVDMPHLRDAISDILYITYQSDNIKKESPPASSDEVQFSTMNEPANDTIEIEQDITKSQLLDLWNSFGCTKYITYNEYCLPGRFKKSIYDEYLDICNKLTFYDLGCEIIYKFTGSDKHQVVNQFISCKIPENETEVSYGCIINNNGHILDIGYTFYSKSEDTIYIVTSGYNRNIQSSFIAEYIIYCKRSGLDVKLDNEDYHVIALNGWDCKKFFGNKYFNNFIHTKLSDFSNNDIFNGLNLIAVRISYTGNDGIHFICPSDMVMELVGKLREIAEPVGLIAVNIRRMESGIFLPCIDMISNQSPFTASLSWTVHLPKIRNKTLFGHTLFTSQIAHLRRKRVALLSPTHLKSGSVLLSPVTRSPVGQVSSCVWSFYYNCRLAYAYISPEFAKHGKMLIAKTRIRLPKETPQRILRAALKSRMNTKQSWALVIRSPPIKINTGTYNRPNKFNKSKIEESQENLIFEIIEYMKEPVIQRYKRPNPTF